jgi:hypothetical protein
MTTPQLIKDHQAESVNTERFRLMEGLRNLFAFWAKIIFLSHRTGISCR